MLLHTQKSDFGNVVIVYFEVLLQLKTFEGAIRYKK
jgi:hypothetical protein